MEATLGLESRLNFGWASGRKLISSLQKLAVTLLYEMSYGWYFVVIQGQ